MIENNDHVLKRSTAPLTHGTFSRPSRKYPPENNNESSENVLIMDIKTHMNKSESLRNMITLHYFVQSYGFCVTQNGGWECYS